jgi:coenzyme F420-dependent glucose-6-phosphate dehydrogenase
VDSFGKQVLVGVSVNNVTEFAGKNYNLLELIRAGAEAEAMGFDGIWVHDAPFGRRTTAAYDPVNLLSAIAGKTKRIFLGTGILAPQLRNPVLLAQQWATLHAASEGRALMGVGTGAGKPSLVQRQFKAVGALRHDTALDPQKLYEGRGRMFAETMDIMRRLWSEDKISYDGEFYKFEDITLGFARPPSMPPVLMGAGIYFPLQRGGPVHHAWKEKNAGKFLFGPYKRIVDYADGWLGLHLKPEEYEEKWQRVEAYAQETKPGKGFVKALNCFVNVDDDPDKAWQGVKDHLGEFHGPPIWDDLVDRWAVSGPPEAVAAKLQGYIDIGVTVFQLVIGSPDQLGQMRRIAEEVLPRLKR